MSKITENERDTLTFLMSALKDQIDSIGRTVGFVAGQTNDSALTYCVKDLKEMLEVFDHAHAVLKMNYPRHTEHNLDEIRSYIERVFPD